MIWEVRVKYLYFSEKFCVMANQESTASNRCIGFVPDKVTCHKTERTYVQHWDHKPQFLEPHLGRYLAQLRSEADGILDREDLWVSELQPFSSAPTSLRRVSLETLRLVMGAIWRSEAIKVKYRSLSGTEPRWRWIAPHAVAFDRFHRHKRACCLTDNCFKSFLLSRILDIRGSRESETSANDDRDWNSEITLEDGPHSELPETPAKVIALDCCTRGGKAKIKARRALLYFAPGRLGLDTDLGASKPQYRQMVLLDREVVHEDHG